MAKKKRRAKGEGSIIKRNNGTWRAEFTIGYGVDGKRRRRYAYGKT